MRRALVVAVTLFAGCARPSTESAKASAPTDPEKADERCERLGELRKISVSPEDAAWFEKECICLDQHVGCGKILSKRYAEREAPFKARRPRVLTPDERQKAEPLLASLRKNSDEMAGWIWYSDPVAGKQVLGRYVRFYFGQKSGSETIGPLRLKVQYQGDDWVFAHGLTFKVDDVLLELNPERSEWKRDNGSGSVWEVLDIAINDDHPEIAKALASAKSVKVRFRGSDGVADFVVPKKQLEGLARVYAAWQACAGVSL